ncbi:helix-turn-helix transcriptional regulator [Mucilaginibacter sp.]|uniref:helix-turn-helix domain-containing protein n=1 Tax=Mucilaginibacter sp. TaxID=1882438 RepID=UPI002629708E|nr:helix-turn-helix transcriptional regulator [Mucilaginibacter sp.]MDB4921209.1 hypothetical protein [Mucilaginibacter sp.]
MLDKEQQTVFYEALGEKIRDARKRKNLNQEDLAEKLGMSRVSIVNIETGKQRLPLHVLSDISEILNITLGELLPQVKAADSNNLDPAILNKIRKETEDSSNSSEKVMNYVLSLMKKNS